MSVSGFFLGNLLIILVMTTFSVSWDAIAALRGRGRVGEKIYAYKPSRAEWSAFYWRRARTYFLSYLFVLSLFVLLPWLLGRRQMVLGQLVSMANLLPGLIGYFVLAGLVPPRITFYPEGFRCSALIPFLPGQRNREARTYSDFRVGIRFWRNYREAMPRGDVLILKGEGLVGTQLIIPHGGRDQLLNLAREGLKKAKEEKRQSKKDQRPRSTKTEN